MIDPSLETADSVMRAAEAQDAFWHEHHEEFLSKYAEKFVAVRDGVVIAAEDDLRRLILSLSGRNIDIKSTWVRFLSASPNNLLL